MEEVRMAKGKQLGAMILVLVFVGAVFFAAGLAYSTRAKAEEKGKSKTIYPDKTELDFEGTGIEGELRNPGEFYFQSRREEKFDSLVKRRPHFHREMLRDSVLGK